MGPLRSDSASVFFGDAFIGGAAQACATKRAAKTREAWRERMTESLLGILRLDLRDLGFEACGEFGRGDVGADGVANKGLARSLADFRAGKMHADDSGLLDR